MKLTLRVILLTSLMIAAQSSAFAVTSDSIMCSGGIVSIGDMASDVVGKCGQPTYASQREQKIIEDDSPGERIITTIIIDDWTFNFGPDRFQYRVILHNSRVWSIESLNYGY